MKHWLQFLGIILSGLLLHSCSTTQKIELMKPEPDEASAITYPITSSYISFPINLVVKDIETQTNKALNGLIYEDTNLEDDKIEMKIWKNAPIQIKETSGKLNTIIPLKIWARVKYGTNALGLNLYDIREFNMNGTVALTSNVHMSNWKISTQTELENIEWNESPTVVIAGKENKNHLLNQSSH